MQKYKKERTTQTCKTPGKTTCRIKDMGIKQERKDDRKNEGQNDIHNVIFHDGKASKSGIFPQFSA